MATSRTSILKRKPGLLRYRLGSEEKIMGPDISTMARAIRVQGAVSLRSCAEDCRRIPRPNRRRSTTAMVPTETAKDAMWMISSSGKDHSLLLRGLVDGSYTSMCLLEPTVRREGRQSDFGGKKPGVDLIQRWFDITDASPYDQQTCP